MTHNEHDANVALSGAASSTVRPCAYCGKAGGSPTRHEGGVVYIHVTCYRKFQLGSQRGQRELSLD
jgi:hypothetical protein